MPDQKTTGGAPAVKLGGSAPHTGSAAWLLGNHIIIMEHVKAC